MHRNKKVGWIALVLGVSGLCGSVAVASPGVRLDGTIQESGLSPAGGTMTGPVCWYDTSSSVCVDSTTAGQLTIYGSGATNNEELVCDFETTANVIALSSSTGVTQITAAGMDINPATVTLGAGGQWKAGTDDGMVCLQEVDTVGDNICLQTLSDVFKVFEGDGTTPASMTAGSLVTSGTIYSGAQQAFRGASPAGAQLLLDDTTTTGTADGTASVQFRAYDAGGGFHVMNKMYLDVTDATAGAEMADMVFEATTNGTDATEYMRLDSSADEVTVSSNLSIPIGDKLILDGSAGASYLTAYSGSEIIQLYRAGTLRLNVDTDSIQMYTGTSGNTQFIPQASTSEVSPTMRVYRWDDTPTAADEAGAFEFAAKDSAGNIHVYGKVYGEISDPTTTAEYGDIVFEAATNGTDATEYMRLDSSAGVVALSAGLQHHNGTALPATCVVGQVFLDTDSDDCADTGSGDGCICICKSTNTWAVVQDI